MVSTPSLIFATAVATVLQQAAAHTVMISPKPVFPANEYDSNSPVARMDSSKLPGSAPSDGYSSKRIVSAIQATEGKTLRALIRKYATTTYDIDCGKTVLTGAKQQVPDEIDFPWGHIGPCEAWCDDTRVFYDDNCRGNNVGKIKVDKSKCANAKRLQVMYAGVHTPTYEVYANCVALSGSGTSGGDDNDDNDDASTATPPASTPKVSPVPAVTHKPATTMKPVATPKPVKTQKPAATKPSTEAPYPPATVSPPGGNTVGGKHCGVTSDLDSWCTANCGMGFCPETHCKSC